MSKTALIILDGVACNPNQEANAVYHARTPVLDSLVSKQKFSLLETSGKYVGLPEGQMGNSEVGHLNIGAGRVVLQDLERINESIDNLPQKFDTFCEGAKRIHLIGLCSYGGVHSSLQHCLALVKALKGREVYVHAITDGRDVAIGSCIDDIGDLLDSGAEVASVIGRYYAMDRDNREEKTRKAYELFSESKGEKADDILKTLKARLDSGETDEFIEPICLNPEGAIKPGDSLIFFNYRADRMRQIVKCYLDTNPVLTFTSYDETFDCEVLFAPEEIKNHLGEVVSKEGLRQFRLAETEKYPHVTYFFSGGVERILEGEERVVIPSPRDVRTYDEKPEMSAEGVKNKLVEVLKNAGHELVVCNFANCDMVGHTGSFEATVKAVETVDKCLGDILSVKGYSFVVTADHGNADQMKSYETGEPHTYHTKYPVWCFVLSENGEQLELKKSGALCDVAPTVLELMGVKQPEQMTGSSLLVS